MHSDDGRVLVNLPPPCVLLKTASLVVAGADCRTHRRHLERTSVDGRVYALTTFFLSLFRPTVLFRPWTPALVQKHLCQLLSRSEMLVAILSTACAQHIAATNIVLEYNERCNIIHTEFFWIGLVQI